MGQGYQTLLSPLTINGMTVKNRMVMCAMSSHMAPFSGETTQREIDYYEARAAGGVGMIVVGAAFVDPLGSFGNGQLGLWKDELVDGAARLAEAIKRHDCKASIQIHHAGRQTSRALCGGHPVAPSAIALPGNPEPPRELSGVETKMLVEQFGQTARRAKQAGFDAIELHFAHGYLPGQFLSRLSNQRIDEYGGDFDHRARFMREILARVRDEVGEETVLSAKISGHEFTEGGLTLDDAKRICKCLEEMGLNYVTISSGYYPYVRIVPNMVYPEALNVPLAAEIKGVLDIPVMTQGRIHHPDLAEDILQAGQIDLVGLGRPLIADPEFPNKVKEGRIDEIVRCLSCNKGCHDRYREDRSVACLINPQAGREATTKIQPAGKKKKVMVIGAGPGGMEAARVATRRGHEVEVYERHDIIGGRVRLAWEPPTKDNYRFIVDRFDKAIDQLDIKVHFNTEVTPELVEEKAPDAVIVATGAENAYPPIPGLREHGISADDILSGKDISGRTVVVGGGAVGCETAHYLAERGVPVVLVEMLPAIGMGLTSDGHHHLMEAFKTLDIVPLTSTTVLSIVPGEVKVQRDNREEIIGDIENVVVACGATSNNQMVAELKKLISEVIVIGDAKEPRDALEAIHEGAAAARKL